MKKFVILFFVICFMMLANRTFALEKGDKAPDFTLKDLEGRSVSLSDFRGQTVVLNFWATWCPTCRAEMPEFKELNDEYRESKEAAILMVNMSGSRGETQRRIAKFMQSNGYDMRVLMDTKRQAAVCYQIRGIPTTLVIDKNGVIRGQIVGATTKQVVKALVKGTK